MSSHEVLETKKEPLSLGDFKHAQVERLKDVSFAADCLERMTPEQWDFVHKTALAMAEKFAQPGLRIEDINIVPVPEITGSIFRQPDYSKAQMAVMDTASRGLNAGSWINIFSESAAPFMTIEVNRREIDTREGLSREVYEGFVASEFARGINPMPDSRELAEKAKIEHPVKPSHHSSLHDWSSTWETGGGRGNRSLRVEHDGRVEETWNFETNDYGSTYFRPAVKIPSIEELRTSI